MFNLDIICIIGLAYSNHQGRYTGTLQTIIVRINPHIKRAILINALYLIFPLCENAQGQYGQMTGIAYTLIYEYMAIFVQTACR